jgi:hypothetical protein
VLRLKLAEAMLKKERKRERPWRFFIIIIMRTKRKACNRNGCERRTKRKEDVGIEVVDVKEW